MKKIIKQIPRFFCKDEDVGKYFLSGDKLKEQLTLQQKLEIINQSTFFDEQYFKQKGDLFDIKNKELDRTNFANTVTAYGQDNIFVNEVAHSTTIIVFESMVLQWDIGGFNYHSPESFKILELIQPKPEYIIVGTDVKQKQLNKQTDQYLKRILPAIKVDCIDFFTAISTFNSCMTDNIKAVAFLSIHQLIVLLQKIYININDKLRYQRCL